MTGQDKYHANSPVKSSAHKDQSEYDDEAYYDEEEEEYKEVQVDPQTIAKQQQQMLAARQANARR